MVITKAKPYDILNDYILDDLNVEQRGGGVSDEFSFDQAFFFFFFFFPVDYMLQITSRYFQCFMQCNGN